ncbi:hypothetical protein E3P78_04075 [Wallemia ichthyophaga]|nr:hypothetical protein E3P78_04075 [Wallemia ichthyophaga]
MPRNSRSSGGSRPSASSSAPRSSPFGSQQTRSASTAAPAYGAQRSNYAQQQSHPQPQQQAQPAAAPSAGGSMMGNIASTAAGVAAGHGLSNMLFGGSSSQPAPVEQQAQPQQQPQQQQQPPVCETQAKDFVTCLNATGDVNSCSTLLDLLKHKRPSPPESDDSDDDHFTFSPVNSPALNSGTFTNGNRKFVLTPAHEFYYRQKLLSLARTQFKTVNDYSTHVTAIVQKLMAAGIRLTETEATHAYIRGLPNVTAQAVLSSLENGTSFTGVQILTQSVEEARSSAVMAGQYAAEQATEPSAEPVETRAKKPSTSSNRRVRYRSHSVTTQPTSNHLMTSLTSTPQTSTMSRPRSIAFPKTHRPSMSNTKDIYDSDRTPVSDSLPKFTPLSPPSQSLLSQTENLSICSPSRHPRPVARRSPYASPTKSSPVKAEGTFGLGLGLQ